jgi:hypothetical protein
MQPLVFTGREPEEEGNLLYTPNADGSYTVSIRNVQEELHLAVDFTAVGPSSDNDRLPTVGLRVWASDRRIHITSDRDGEALIRDLIGRTVKAVALSAGETVSLTLPAGVYIVTAGGLSRKVSAGNRAIH